MGDEGARERRQRLEELGDREGSPPSFLLGHRQEITRGMRMREASQRELADELAGLG